MKKFKTVVIGDAVMILGDAAEVIPTLAPVDAVIADPPYSDRTHKGARTNKKSVAGKRLITFPAISDATFLACVEHWLAAAQGWVVATVDFRHAALLVDHPNLVRIGAWVKNNPMPQLTGDRPGQGHETVIVLHSGKRRKAWNRRGGPAIWRHNVCNRASIPTEKPIGLVRDFVRDFTKPGDLVLDSHAGAGTTAVACLQEGRRFVGIERDRAHFDIACRRIKEAANGL